MNQLNEHFAKLSLNEYSIYDPTNYDYIVSVDIGIKHMGLCLCAINRDYTFNEIIWFELIDITDFNHTNEWPRRYCHLHHDKTMCDYLTHIFYTHHELLEAAKYILIERQPPVGLVSVEQLIFSKYRHKAILVSPNSMHKWMGWNRPKLDYERRKEESEEFARRYLMKGERDYLVTEFDQTERRHDISDAICIVLFFLYKKRVDIAEVDRKIKLSERIKEAEKSDGFRGHIKLEQYMFTEKINLTE